MLPSDKQRRPSMPRTMTGLASAPRPYSRITVSPSLFSGLAASYRQEPAEEVSTCCRFSESSPCIRVLRVVADALEQHGNR